MTVFEKNLVILPTYNESATLETVVQGILDVISQGVPLEILIVDDNSPDGTGALADQISAYSPAVHVLHRPGKSGLGPAYLAGFDWGLTRDFENFIEMDADGSHHPDQLPAILKARLDGYELVLGTRWMPGGEVHNWALGRRLISRFGTRYAATALKLPYKDLTSGYRLLSRQLLEIIVKRGLKTSGYGFQIEIVDIAVEHGFRIAEVPITFTERMGGSSKMSKAIVFEAWLGTSRAGFRRLINRR